MSLTIYISFSSMFFFLYDVLYFLVSKLLCFWSRSYTHRFHLCSVDYWKICVFSLIGRIRQVYNERMREWENETNFFPYNERMLFKTDLGFIILCMLSHTSSKWKHRDETYKCHHLCVRVLIHNIIKFILKVFINFARRLTNVRFDLYY